MPARFMMIVGLCAALGIRSHAGPNILPDEPWNKVAPDEASLTVETVSLDRPIGGQTTALKLTVLKASQPYYRIQITQDVPRPIADSTRLRLSFYARSRTTSPMRAVVEKSGPPYTAAIEMHLRLTPEWKLYSGAGVSLAYPARGMGVRFQVGHQEGEIELAAIRLEDEGPDPALIRARQAVEPEAVEKRILQNRTGTVKVVVRDAAGKPVKGADVSVRQTGHAFLFGSNIFGLSPSDTSETQRLYQERFKALLNFATLPFYWGSFEPQEGQKAYDRLGAMARWCRDNGLLPKGHPLIWHEVYPRWAPADPDKAIPLLEGRVRDIIAHFKGLIPVWDVLNEANNAPDYAQTGTGAWIKRDGAAKVVSTALRWAREASAGTKNVLLYNDFNTGEANVRLLTELQSMNALPDAIGIQSHMHGGTWPAEHVWATVERFAVFKRPIHFTEVTVVSGPRPSDASQPWVTTPEGEKAQADYVERFYSILYSHPAVEAITWWDFSDLQAWQQAPAGFLRKDMSPKPAYDRLMGLIKGKWWTKADVRTDGLGACSVRAFQGTHVVDVKDARGRTVSRTVSLPKGRKSLTVTVTLR